MWYGWIADHFVLPVDHARLSRKESALRSTDPDQEAYMAIIHVTLPDFISGLKTGTIRTAQQPSGQARF